LSWPAKGERGGQGRVLGPPSQTFRRPRRAAGRTLVMSVASTISITWQRSALGSCGRTHACTHGGGVGAVSTGQASAACRDLCAGIQRSSGQEESGGGRGEGGGWRAMEHVAQMWMKAGRAGRAVPAVLPSSQVQVGALGGLFPPASHQAQVSCSQPPVTPNKDYWY
jgi:hypothetical protein